MVEIVGTQLTQVIKWVGQVITALVGEAGELKELLPLFCVGISISALMLGVKVIRSFTWGN